MPIIAKYSGTPGLSFIKSAEVKRALLKSSTLVLRPFS